MKNSIEKLNNKFNLLKNNNLDADHAGRKYHGRTKEGPWCFFPPWMLTTVNEWIAAQPITGRSRVRISVIFLFAVNFYLIHSSKTNRVSKPNVVASVVDAT